MAKLVSGQTVYVKVKNCKLFNKPSIDGLTLVVLQPKTGVVWLAQAPNSKEFHQVRCGNLIGFIYYACLQQEPVTEISLKNDPSPKCHVCEGRGYTFKGKEIHPVCLLCDGKGKLPSTVFASSGAANKA